MIRLSLPLLLLATAASTQQPAPYAERAEVKLSSTFVNTNPTVHVWMKIASPKQPSPGAGPGQVHTSRVVYTAWWDTDTNGDYELAFDRSTDGGWTWGNNRKVIFTNNGAVGEWTRLQHFRLLCYEHQVFVVLLTSRFHPSGSSTSEAIVAIGSEDQGQTWGAPILLSTGVNGLTTGVTLNDCSTPACAVSLGALHTAFAANYSIDATGAPSLFYDIYYVRAAFINGSLTRLDPEEQRVDGAKGPAGSIDSDNPGIEADGPVVCVAWHDDRVLAAVQNPYAGNNNWNNFYVKTSITLGGDFTVIPEHNLTNRTTGLFVFTNPPQCGVSGLNVYVLQEDGRNTGAFAHDAFLSVSRDAGVTWQQPALINKGPRLSINGTVNEVDAGRMVVDGSRIVVPYLDSRFGNNNNPNTLFVIVDNNDGVDIQAGTHIETQLTLPTLNSSDADLFNTDISGDTIGIAYEPRHPGGGEDATIAFSSDGGTTWGHRYIEFGTVDCDGPNVAISLNGDINAIWHDARSGGGNSANEVFVRGLSSMRVVDQTSLLKFEVTGAPSNQVVFMFPSLTVPTSAGFTIDAARGIDLNFVPDNLTVAAVGAFAPFIAVTDAQGNAAYTWPNFAQLIGIDIYYAAATFDPSVSLWTRFSDPLLQAK